MIRFLLNIYIFILFADGVLSYFPQFNNEEWRKFLKKAADYTLNPVRKLLPQGTPVDFSPLVVIFLIYLIRIIW